MSESIPAPFRIAILGANGQVGTELCLYLKVMGFCDLIAIARSSNSTAFLSRAGIDCRSGDLANPEIAAKLLNDCDLIVDLALPNGKNLRETKRIVGARLTSIFLAARPSKGFVLASTTTVYRYSASLPFFRAYRSMKLFSEHVSQSLGAKRGVPVYVFRLGQVHGALQSCSDLLRRELLSSTGPIHVPDQPSNSIFVFSIAEAIQAILFERTTPSIYTLISNPAWSFADLAKWHAGKIGLNATVVLERVRLTSPIAKGLAAIRNWVKLGLSGLIGHYKELLSALVSAYSEALDQKLRFFRTRQIAALSVNAYFRGLAYRPFEALNETPGIRFPFITDSRTTMEKPERCVEKLIRSLK